MYLAEVSQSMCRRMALHISCALVVLVLQFSAVTHDYTRPEFAHSVWSGGHQCLTKHSDRLRTICFNKTHNCLRTTKCIVSGQWLSGHVSSLDTFGATDEKGR
jgi:hypothetical protein